MRQIHIYPLPLLPVPGPYHTGAPASLGAMSITSAVANAAAAAAAAGAGKKAAQVQLQAELNTDDEWNKFIQRDGLLGELSKLFSSYISIIFTDI